MSQPATHWNAVFSTRELDEVSWYQARPETSLALLREVAGAVIDVGAGASTLVDELLDDGRTDITVLDVSAEALSVTRQRLGQRADQVRFVVADILEWEPDRMYAGWHDRAVFHFLTDPVQQARYVDLASRAVGAGGVLVLATFGTDGPTTCSGLPTARYSATDLAALFAPHFSLTHSDVRVHVTPSGAEQQFTWVSLRRNDTD